MPMNARRMLLAAGLFVAGGAALAQAGMAKIVIGQRHACGLTTAGGVACWGNNDRGQLGDATQTSRLSPVNVYGLSSGVKDIGAFWDMSCALTTSGSVHCWGDLGTQTAFSIPREQADLASGIAAFAKGDQLCVITDARTVKCRRASALVEVAGLSDVVSVAGNGWAQCALTAAGEVKCWGDNTTGALGDGTFVSRNTPATVRGLSSGVRSLSGSGFHFCAVLADRTVRCWGSGRDYVLGIGSTESHSIPVEPVGLGGNISEVVAGGNRSCAINQARELRCWGGQGALGHGDASGRGTAAGLLAVVLDTASATAWGANTCAVTTGGAALCWGINTEGIVGDGAGSTPLGGTARWSPTSVVGFPGHARANYQGLWWKSPAGSESGWGLNLTHQGDVLFGTWFTYAADGTGMWLVMPEGRRVGAQVYSGALYRTTGPAFSAAPWNPAAVVAIPAGEATLVFASANSARFLYTVDGVSQEKDITRQVYASLPVCAFAATPSSSNYQDLWWAAPAGSESGWGVNLAHQDDIVFATWFTYDTAGKQMWLVMPEGRRTAANVYSGPLYRTMGPSFSTFSPASPPVAATLAGTATFTFTGASTGTFAFMVNGVSRTKSIARQTYASPSTSCRPG